MTMPDERVRALVWAGGFLIELARDEEVPLRVRRKAVSIARHFPTIEELHGMALQGGPGLESPYKDPAWAENCQFGPLRYGTRLSWPDP